MATFTRTYTDSQRQAVIAARLDDRLTAKQVVEAAARGELADGPFHIPIGTVYRVGREGAHEREAQEFVVLARRDPNLAKDELIVRMLAVLDRQQRQLENADRFDFDEFERLVSLIPALGRAQRTVIPRDQPAPQPKAPTIGLVDQLREAHEQSDPAPGPKQLDANRNGHHAQHTAIQAPEPEQPPITTGIPELDRRLSQQPAVRHTN